MRWMSFPGAKQKRKGEEAMKKRALILALVITLLVGSSLYWVVSAQAQSRAGTSSVSGAGTSIIEGGTGAPSFHPVETTFAFHWSNGQGHFECLALTPGAPPGTLAFPLNTAVVPSTLTDVIGPVTYIALVSKLPLPAVPGGAPGVSARHSRWP